jgi:hypothetical protein
MDVTGRCLFGGEWWWMVDGGRRWKECLLLDKRWKECLLLDKRWENSKEALWKP